MDAREIYERAYAEALAENLNGSRIEDLPPGEAATAREYAQQFAWDEVQAAHELGCVRRPCCELARR